jgi:hypothetical protein
MLFLEKLTQAKVTFTNVEKNIPCPLNIPDSLEDALEFYSSGMI